MPLKTSEYGSIQQFIDFSLTYSTDFEGTAPNKCRKKQSLECSADCILKTYLSCLCGDERTCCEVFVREPPVTIVTGFEDVQIIDGDEATFKVSAHFTDNITLK